VSFPPDGQKKAVLSQRQRQSGGREDGAGAFQTGWAGWGTGYDSIPQEHTGTSPVAAQCGLDPKGHRHLKKKYTYEQNIILKMLNKKESICICAVFKKSSPPYRFYVTK
jgi:hypothetical protein